MQLLFKNAYVVDVHSPYHLQTVDILVEGSQITSIGDLPEMDCPSVDLEGATLTTGFAELHSDLESLEMRNVKRWRQVLQRRLPVALLQ